MTRFHTPFDALARLRGSDFVAPAAPLTKAAPQSPRGASGVARAVVRLERSGRSGKAVTVVSHLELAPADLERWLKSLKGALGCGGTVEDDAIVLQGDQRERLRALLTARGVKKITMG